MSKYKVGDKFIVEIEEIYNGDLAKHEEHMHLHRIKGFNSLVLDEYGLDKLQKINPKLKIEDIDDMLAEHDLKKEAYEKGLQDAWELARKIFAMKDKEFDDVFGYAEFSDAVYYNTPQEALAKIEAYEESKAIKVGDEITSVGNAIKGYVIEKSQEREDCYVVLVTNYKDLRTATYNKTVIKKTGRHIDIEHLLEQIRGNE